MSCIHVFLSYCAVCQPLPALANGVINYNNQGVGGVATHSCDSGFSLSGEPVRTCGADGTWSGSIPTCVG